MAKAGGAPENLNPVRTKEEAKTRGKAGGMKSGEARRKKRDAKQAAKLILDLACQKNVAENLKSMKIPEEDFTNRVALMARMFAKAMTGDVSSTRLLFEMAGEDPRYILDQSKFDFEKDNREGSNNAVDDWVSSIPDTITEEDRTDGNSGASEAT